MGLGRNLTLKYSLKKCFFNPHLRIYLLIREREREKRQLVAPTRDQTHKLGMCPDRGPNPQPFAVRYDAPTN